MDDRILRLEQRVEVLTRTVEDLARRLPPSKAVPPPADLVPADAPREPSAYADAVVSVPAALGRLVLVLAGAFLLRALTDSGTVSQPLGVGLGLAYAAVWTFLADRAARGHRTLDATFHGASTAIVAFPIVWEASARFGVFDPAAGAVVLAGVTAMTLGMAWFRRLGVLAILVALSSLLAGVGLLWATHALVPYGVVLFLVTGACLAASYQRDWPGLRWPPALILDIVILLAGLLAGAHNQEWLDPGTVMAAQLGLAGMFLGGFAVRTLALRQEALAFELLQLLAALAIGLGGAIRLASLAGEPTAALGAVVLVTAVAAWSAGCFVVERRQGEDGRNAAAYAILGTLLALAGLPLVAPAPVVAMILGALALGAVVLGRREGRKAVRVLAALLALAAAVASGLVGAVTRSFTGGVASGDVPLESLVVAVAGGTAYLVLRGGDRRDRSTWTWTVPALAFVGVAGAALAVLLVGLLASLLPGADADASDPGVVAAARTAVLAVLAVALALAARRRLRRELPWAAWAVLALMALKILFEDVPRGRPATLFVSLALFGASLVLATGARVRRKATS